ncbi:phospholipase B1, membrane-associated-like [Neocloeon triangulifer]|uniref:phospholipase B1, membrane-associated-like n=1 Tax=Neocloeon triangulifer TaxID=2078957 RepID=UPI00286EC97F|nr:phospholipase B1, membrane-associated-like [Neocloeon triangulifer]
MVEFGAERGSGKLLLCVLLLTAAAEAFFLPFLDIKNEKQAVIPRNVPFPCPREPGARSPERPSSAHQLRPGDIDVVATIGDSLTAATGAVARAFYDVITVDNRGMSWSGGGQGNWRQYLTLPNILKEYNPNVTGQSLGDGLSQTPNAQFNVAVNGAMDQDIPFEAVELVRRMRADRRVDFKNHWKMITIWVGTNDLCTDFCYDPNQGADAHMRNLQKTLDYLYEHVPRAFVNLVSAPYVPSYTKLKDLPNLCLSLLPILCSCLFGGNEAEKLRNVTLMTRRFQKVERMLVESKRYDGRPDFALEFQPTYLDNIYPTVRLNNGRLTTDYSYMSIDCFHFSQKLHAVAANTLWNNLFEPPWEKTTTWKPLFQKFLCPTTERPFFVTRENSKSWTRRKTKNRRLGR